MRATRPSCCPFRSLKEIERDDALAERYGGRPSSYAGIEDPYLARCYDDAARIAGYYADQRHRRAAEQAAGDQSQSAPAPRQPQAAPATGASYDPKTHTLTGAIPVVRRAIKIVND